jgi:hypothetical protein
MARMNDAPVLRLRCGGAHLTNGNGGRGFGPGDSGAQEAAMMKDVGERDSNDQGSKLVQASKVESRKDAQSEPQFDQISSKSAMKRARRLRLGEHFVATLKL